MYAIVEISGFQYRVEPNTTIKVPKLEKKVGDEVTISNVMLFSDGQRVKIGKPFLEGATVKGVVVSQAVGRSLLCSSSSDARDTKRRPATDRILQR